MGEVEMEEVVNQYLDVVFNNLKPLRISEKTDIINEIKSHIKEKQQNSSESIEQILSDLGDPKELAKSYVGDKLLEKDRINLNQLVKLIGHYSVTGLTSIIVVPTLGLTSIIFSITSILLVGLAIINIPIWYFKLDIPWTIVNLVFWQPKGIIASIIILMVAYGLYWASKWLWRLLKAYIVHIKR